MARSHVQIAADIVEQTVERGVISADLFIEASDVGINVDALMAMAEDLYELATEQAEEAFDYD